MSKKAMALTIGVTAVCAGISYLILRAQRVRRRRRRRTGRYISGRQFLISARQASGFFGTDIGGTLAKLVYLAPDGSATNIITDHELFGETGEKCTEMQFHSKVLGGALHFLRFETESLEPAIRKLRPTLSGGGGAFIKPYEHNLYVSGGGAYKFAQKFELVGLNFTKVDELEALVVGFRFLCLYGPEDEVFKMSGELAKTARAAHSTPIINALQHRKPCIIVNIGSGVSILKVTEDNFQRIGGTSLGGGTFLGLCRLISGVDTFEEAMELCTKGDSSNVDKLVKDIYGGDYTKFNLPGSIVACSLGKLSTAVGDVRKQFRNEDVALALLVMVTQQISLLAIHLAKQHKCEDSVFFVGGFLKYNPIAMQTIAFACDYFQISALFLKHADFLGALGTLCRSVQDTAAQRINLHNASHSSSAALTTAAAHLASLSSKLYNPDLKGQK